MNVFYLPGVSDDGRGELRCARCARPLGPAQEMVQNCEFCATRHVLPLAALPPALAERLRDPNEQAALAQRAARMRRTMLSIVLLLIGALLLLALAGQLGAAA